MASFVVDSSAVLAVINGEPGGEIVAALINDSLLSAVNFAEVMTKLVQRGGSLERAQNALVNLDLNVVDFDRELAEHAGGLVAQTKVRGLSLGDRCCLALALRERIPVVTADRVWQNTGLGIEVRLFR